MSKVVATGRRMKGSDTFIERSVFLWIAPANPR